MTKEERAYNYASTRKTTKFQVGEITKFYNDGYEQAEKELALTWEDMRKIHEICEDVWEPNVEDEKPIYEEVLRRFNEQRRK